MASAFKVTVVGYNGRSDSLGEMVFNTVGAKAGTNGIPTEVSTANTVVMVPNGVGSAVYTNYYVTETLAQVLAAMNQDAVTDLSVTGTLNATGAVTFDTTLAVTGATTLSSTLTVAGASTFNGDVALGAGDDLTGSTTSNILGFNTMAPIPTLPVAVAINATATMADGNFRSGYITSTSAAATAITTRTATQLATELGAAGGTLAYLVINNVSGASTVTLTPGAGVTAASAITGGTDMTVAATEIGVFLLVFVSTTVAQICRIQ